MQFTQPLSLKVATRQIMHCSAGSVFSVITSRISTFMVDVLERNPHATPFKFEIRRRLQFKICVVALGNGGTSDNNKHLGADHRWIGSLDKP